MYIKRFVVFVVIALGFNPGSAQAQEFLRAGVVGTVGGGTMSDERFVIHSTLGQAAVGTVTSTERLHGAGFWFAFTPEPLAGVDTEDTLGDVPTTYTLEPNYPNPFNPSTNITYALPEPAEVKVRVFDTYGREIATLVNQQQPSGRYTVRFNAKGLASGLYLYRMVAGTFEQTRTMLLVK